MNKGYVDDVDYDYDDDDDDAGDHLCPVILVIRWTPNFDIQLEVSLYCAFQ